MEERGKKGESRSYDSSSTVEEGGVCSCILKKCKANYLWLSDAAAYECMVCCCLY